MMMTISNRHSDIELVSPVYFCAGGTHYAYPVEQKDKGVAMKFDFRFDPDQDESGGILMYEIQRKENAKSNQPSKIIEEAPKTIRLLVIWKTKHLKEPKLSVILVEYDNKLVLNENKLAQLYEKFNDIPANYYRNTWLMWDNITLDESRKLLWHTSFELEIIISKGFRGSDIIRPMWIDSERQVLSLII
jgi:hypothetical protein